MICFLIVESIIFFRGFTHTFLEVVSFSDDFELKVIHFTKIYKHLRYELEKTNKSNLLHDVVFF